MTIEDEMNEELNGLLCEVNSSGADIFRMLDEHSQDKDYLARVREQCRRRYGFPYSAGESAN